MPDTPAAAMLNGPLDGSRAAVRAVHAAAAALRAGRVVALGGQDHLLVAAAETLDAASLEAFPGDAVLVLADMRAAAVLGAPGDATLAAVTVPAWSVPALRGLADPTAPQVASGVRRAGFLPGAAAAVALAKLARLLPAVLVAPAPPKTDMRPKGDMRPGADMPAVAAEDVLRHPDRSASLLRRIAAAHVPLEAAADCRLISFREEEDGTDHLAILIGRPEDMPAPLVRVHSECFTGDVLGSLRCDCGAQLRAAIDRMAAEGGGAVLYLAQEGRGIGLANKLRAYALQDQGLDTLDANRALGFGADERRFLVAAVMLEQLGLRRVRLLTNNPDKLAALTACGIDVAARESLLFAANGVNDRYLATKRQRFGHLLPE